MHSSVIQQWLRLPRDQPFNYFQRTQLLIGSAERYQKYTVTIYWHKWCHDILTQVMSRYHNILTCVFWNQSTWFPWQLILVIIAWSDLVIANTACLYWLSLFFKQRCTNDLKLERMDQYVAYCDIIAILKIMQYDNCSSTLYWIIAQPYLLGN